MELGILPNDLWEQYILDKDHSQNSQELLVPDSPQDIDIGSGSTIAFCHHHIEDIFRRSSPWSGERERVRLSCGYSYETNGDIQGIVRDFRHLPLASKCPKKVNTSF